MPSFVYEAGGVFLLITLGVGLLRLAWGPTQADRVLSAQLSGTTMVAAVLLLGRAWERPELENLALVLVFLAVFPAFSYSSRLPSKDRETEKGES